MEGKESFEKEVASSFSDSLPRHTAKFGGRVYDVHAVLDVTKELPVETVPTDTFSDAVGEDNKCWDDAEGGRVGPYDLLADWPTARQNPKWKKHVTLIEAVSTEVPILVDRSSGGVFDGTHRLTRAFLDHQPTIKVKYFDELPDSVLAETERK